MQQGELGRWMYLYHSWSMRGSSDTATVGQGEWGGQGSSEPPLVDARQQRHCGEVNIESSKVSSLVPCRHTAQQHTSRSPPRSAQQLSCPPPAN